MPELFNGKSIGTDGLMTPSGWWSSEVFRIYMKSHFLKYIQGRILQTQYLRLMKPYIARPHWLGQQNYCLVCSTSSLFPHFTTLRCWLLWAFFSWNIIKNVCLFPVKPIKQSLALMYVLLLASWYFCAFNLLFRILASIPFSLLKLCYKTLNNKWDLMMSGPASLAVISFIKNWHINLDC